MRFTSVLTKLFLLLALAIPASAAENAFFDWVEPADPSYSVLKEAALKSSEKGWVVDRLREGKRLPQASARNLVNRLQEDQAIDAATKKTLSEAFPLEILTTEPGFKKVEKHAESLADHMDLVDAQLDAFERSWRTNIMGNLSDPTCYVYAGGGFGYNGNGGLYTGGTGISALGSYFMTQWNTAFTGGTAAWNFAFYGSSNGVTDSFSTNSSIATALSVSLDSDWFPGVDIGLGDNINYVFSYHTFSKLIFSGSSGAAQPDPFSAGLTRNPTIKLEAGVGARFTGGLYVRKKRPYGWWWPFSTTQFTLTPTDGFYYDIPFATPNKGKTYIQAPTRLNEFAGRLDWRHLPIFPGLEDTLPYFAWTITANDSGEIYGSELPNNPLPPLIVGRDNKAMALGLDSQIAGGGTLNAEVAYSSSYYSQYWTNGASSFSDDIAWIMSASKAFSTTSYVAQYSHTGPGWNTNSGVSVPTGWSINTAAKVYDTWATYNVNPSGVYSNSDHFSLAAEYSYAWLGLGLTMGATQQINPTGPILVYRHTEGYRYWGPVDGTTYEGPTYNKKVIYKGNAGGTTWQRLQKLTSGGRRDNQEIVWLSQNGAGDPNALEDSVKFINSAQLNASMQLDSLFHLERPFTLNVSSSMTSVDTSLHPWTANDQSDIMVQQISNVSTAIQVTKRFSINGGFGYETSVINRTQFPISNLEHLWGVGLNMDFPDFLTGLSQGISFSGSEHFDPNYSFRHFSQWSTGMSIFVQF